MTAIALLIAALIQLKTQELSLLDGIVVSLITTMMITFAIASSPTRSNTQNQPSEPNGDLTTEVDPNKSFARYFTQFVFVGFWAAWCLNMWNDPIHFGQKDPNCTINSVVTITLFSREIHATDPRMRRAALALVSVGLVIAFLSLFISLEGLLGPLIKSLRKNVPAVISRRPGENGEPEDSILKFIRRSLQALALGTLIFLIVTTEKTILKNDLQKESGEWSYGQTIAVILLLQQVMDISSTYLEKKDEEKWNETKSSGSSDQQDPTMVPMQPLPSSQPQAAAAPPAPNSGATL
ncbi:hypothetical protein FRC07_011609 [Ceratobasidium sp. 392]|nr:hypothetical protein FRC07_011609 [Ceratobasidium sp. 392]